MISRHFRPPNRILHLENSLGSYSEVYTPKIYVKNLKMLCSIFFLLIRSWGYSQVIFFFRLAGKPGCLPRAFQGFLSPVGTGCWNGLLKSARSFCCQRAVGRGLNCQCTCSPKQPNTAPDGPKNHIHVENSVSKQCKIITPISTTRLGTMRKAIK